MDDWGCKALSRLSGPRNRRRYLLRLQSEPKLLIEKLSVEVDTLGRSVERAPPGDSGRRLPI